jgi:hypothetical protein
MSSKRMFMIALALAVSSTFLACGASFAADGASAKKSDSEAATTAQAAPAAVAESKETEKAPRLTIVDPVKDFGVVPKGDKLDWSFIIKNTGNADLQIIAARPGCGCTVADFDKVIKPGESGKVNAHVDTTNFAGPIAKGVTVETNDPNTPTSQLTIHAVVKPYVEAYPAGFVRFNMLQGDTESQSLVFYSEEDDPFQITKIEVPGDYVKASFKKIEVDSEKAQGVGRPGQNQYKVDITVGGPDAKIGPLADKVHIITNSKHQPEYFVSLSGVIRPTIRVEPLGINFGEIAPSDSAATRVVMLKSNDLKTPDRFVVTKAETDTPLVGASVKPTPNKGEYEVTLQIAKGAKAGDINGNVKIYTSDKINPVVTVPIKGTVKVGGAPASSSSK